MRLFPALLLPVALLAACGTPREQCISSVGRELRVIDRLIQETQGNIARGYALAEVTDVRTIRSTCRGRNEDGTRFRFPCDETQTFDRQEPVAISIPEERAKLQSLQERRAQEQARVTAGIQQCTATYPQ